MEVLVVLELDETGEIGSHLEHDIAAPAAVAAVRSSLGSEFFASERERPIAAISGFDMNASTIDEHGCDSIQGKHETWDLAQMPGRQLAMIPCPARTAK
jgi:hypothetical protein